MPARCVTSEDGVLKLVFVGWFVELYYEPITAREIMDRNPEHSVTLPDFWKNPWIVIQPESILKPGRVFYIIPNHVISDLIKAYRLRNQFCSMKYHSQNLRQSPPVEPRTKLTPIYRDPGRFRLQKQLSVDNPRVEMTTTTQFLHRRVKQQSPRMSPRISSDSEQQTSYLKQQSPRISPRISSDTEQQTSYVKQSPRYSPRFSSDQEQQNSYRHLPPKPRGRPRAKRTDTGDGHLQFLEKDLPFEPWSEDELKHETHDQCIKHFSPESRSWVESWLDGTAKQKHRNKEVEGESLVESYIGVRPHHTIEYDCNTGDSVNTPSKGYQVEFDCSNQVHVRKSCLRTQSDNGRKSNGRRVTFILPCKEQKEKKHDFPMTP